MLLVVLLVACSAASPTPTPTSFDPISLIGEAAANIRAASSFRVSINETGPDYELLTDYATVYFRRVTAQYVAPGTMQATVRVLALGLPLDVQIYSQGSDQWYRAIWTGNQWVNQAFAPDFNPETLLAEDTGIQAALKAMQSLNYVGEEQLEDGTEVYHLSATADGTKMAALLGNLIEPIGTVDVDVFVDTSTHMPVRFMITEFNSPFAVTPEVTDSAGSTPEAEPVVWTIDLYDVNAPSEIVTPEVTAQTTPEMTVTAEAGS